MIKRFVKIIFTAIIFFYDSIVLFFSKFIFNKKHSSSILIANLGALGDMIIFINNLEIFTKDLNNKVTIMVDEKFEPLFDKERFNILSIKSNKYLKNPFYRLKTNLRFSKYSFDLIANVRGSRSLIYEDSILRFINGHKVCLYSDTFSNARVCFKVFDPFIFNKIYKYNIDENFHEIERSTIIFNKIFNLKKEPKILNLKNYFSQIFEIKNKKNVYCVLNVGAGEPEKKWDIDNFIKLGNHIFHKYKLIPIYLGDKEDYRAILNSKINLSSNSYNLCGKTDLSEYINMIYNCEFSICNDSSSIHLSVFLDKKAVCIKSLFAEHWYPYPKNLNKEKWGLISDSHLNNISVNSVFKFINNFYNNT